MRNIQSYADIETARKDGDLTAAEEQLIDCCKLGEPCVLDNGTRPSTPSAARAIGADLLRYLITGGCDDCVVHDKGVMLAGAYVANPLDLGFAKSKGATTLNHCHFEQRISAAHTRFEQLSLQGSFLQQGLFAQGSVTVGSIFLNNGFSTKGCIYLNSAQIDGQLNCTGALLEVSKGNALNAQHAHIKGDAILCGGFSAKGCVDFKNAKIGGQFNCTGALVEVSKGNALNAQNAQIKDNVFLDNGFSAKGCVDFMNAKISGQLVCAEGRFHMEKGIALQLQGAQAAVFLWRDVMGFSGELDLSDAQFGNLADDCESWEKVKELCVVGLTYDHITNPGDTVTRLQWLAKGDRMNGEFSPQPYTQLAKVLRDMGHDGDARRVLITKEDRLRQARTSGLAPITRTRNFLFRWLVGYGYRPFNCLWALVLMIAIGSFVAQRAWTAGDFAPNSDVILSTADWQNLAEDNTIKNPALEWSDKTAKGRDYETFQPIAYGFDVVVPIVNIGQEAAWAPSTTRGPWGWHLWWLRWVLSILGWVVTAVGAAAITGIIRQD